MLIGGPYDGQVSGNTIRRFENGIYCEGNYGNTQFVCNTIEDNYYGIYFYGATIGDQGLLGWTDMNKWGGNIIKDLGGTVSSSIVWNYYQVAPYVPVKALTLNNINLTPSIVQTNCATISTPQKNTPTRHTNEDKKEGLDIFPNPTVKTITVNGGTSNIGQILSITSVNGQLMQEKILQSETTLFDVSSWPTGIYFIKCGDKTAKFLKL